MGNVELRDTDGFKTSCKTKCFSGSHPGLCALSVSSNSYILPWPHFSCPASTQHLCSKPPGEKHIVPYRRWGRVECSPSAVCLLSGSASGGSSGQQYDSSPSFGLSSCHQKSPRETRHGNDWAIPSFVLLLLRNSRR